MSGFPDFVGQKTNLIILKIIVGNNHDKTVLETVLRCVIASMVSEELWDKHFSPIGHEIEGFHSKKQVMK